MAIIDLTTVNEYPTTKRFAIGTTAQQFTLPADATSVSFGGNVALYYSTQQGADGESFGPAADITDFGFVPQNNMFSLAMERGQQSVRNLCVASQAGAGFVTVLLIKN